MSEKRINLAIDHSNFGFFSDGMSLLNRQDKFFIDFRQNTPRLDTIGEKQQQTNVVKHNTIILDPVMAKALMNLLQDSLKNFEKQHGKLKLPKLEKVKDVKDVKDVGAAKDPESYFG